MKTSLPLLSISSIAMAIVACHETSTGVEQSSMPEIAGSEDVASITIPLNSGIYVSESQTCADPAFAGLKMFDGQGIASAHTHACHAVIVARTGRRYTLDNSCLSAGDGPADRSTERLVIDIASPQTFSIVASDQALVPYRLCKPSDLPVSLR